MSSRLINESMTSVLEQWLRIRQVLHKKLSSSSASSDTDDEKQADDVNVPLPASPEVETETSTATSQDTAITAPVPSTDAVPVAATTAASE